MAVIDRTKSALLGVALLAGVFAVGTIATKTSNDDSYVLSVKWEPAALRVGMAVDINVTVDGVPLIKKKQRISPWGDTLTAEKGAKVVLTAGGLQDNITLIDCIILRNGRSIPSTGFDSIPHPGSVRCEA